MMLKNCRHDDIKNFSKVWWTFILPQRTEMNCCPLTEQCSFIWTAGQESQNNVDKLLAKADLLFVQILHPELGQVGDQGPGVGRFDFQKFSLIFTPGVSIILFCI